MGRTTKQGIDYFSLDCALDGKTEMYVIETGATGFGILITLWQMIYADEGYYILADDDLKLLIKKRIDADINTIDTCINTALKRGLFDKAIYEKHGVLTSKAIQKRYFDAAKRKKLVRAISEYLLVSVDDYINNENVSINSLNAGKNATKEKEKEKEKECIKSEVQIVFDHWRSVMKHPQSKLDEKRKKYISSALKSYSLDDCKTAIVGCSKTPHNMGKNDRNQVFDGLHIIFKDAENIERFMRNASSSDNVQRINQESSVW